MYTNHMIQVIGKKSKSYCNRDIFHEKAKIPMYSFVYIFSSTFTNEHFHVHDNSFAMDFCTVGSISELLLTNQIQNEIQNWNSVFK